MSAESFRRELQAPSDHIAVAYDAMSWPQIDATVQEVGPVTGLGKTNSAQIRPGADTTVDRLASGGQLAWLDYKFHDIPETVKLSMKEAVAAGASFVTVHASGGEAMLKAAVEGAELGRAEIKDVFKRRALPRIGLVLGITVLTSLDGADCESIFGIPQDDPDGIQKKVIEFTRMAMFAGLDGIVCSPLETQAIRKHSEFGSLLVVNPGITPVYAKVAGDQKRTTSAKEAMSMGADLVVVGRAINQAENYGLTKPQAAQAIAEEIKEGQAA